MDVKKFRLAPYARYYSPTALFGKLKKVGRKAGVRLVYMVLLLYYSTLDKELPVKDRLMVIAALGYFIMPVDLLPDALFGGFTDDTAALLFVLGRVWDNLTPDTLRKARGKLGEWFGEVSDSDLHIPGTG